MKLILTFKSMAIIACSTLILASCNATKETSSTKTNNRKVEINKTYKTNTGLEYEFKELGEGPRAKKGDKVYVHYVGTLTNGNQFDNSRERGEPFAFELGAGKVIAGWDEGIALLNEGDKAILTVPPSLGYGSMDLGIIAPNSILIFEVELVKIEPKEQ